MGARRRGVYASVADIPRDNDGFPVAGLVVRHYRNKKGWTQVQLARKLGTKDLMVRMMETKNQGLDSIERRRLLCKILGIPPILLGLGNTEQLEKLLKPEGITSKVVSLVAHRSESYSIETYRKVLVEYSQTNIRSSGSSLITDIDIIIPALYGHVKNTINRQEKRELLYILWEFHRLAAKIHAAFKKDTSATIRHLDRALVVALELHDASLIAVTHEQVASTRILEQSPHLARANIDAAVAQLKNVSPLIQCDVYALAARIYHGSLLDLEDSVKSRHFLERSNYLLHEKLTQYEHHTPMGLDIIRCRLTYIDSLIQMRRADEAVSMIGDVEKITPKEFKRTEAYLSLDKAACSLLLDSPEYAMQLLSHSYGISRQLGDMQKIEQIKDMYQDIKTGPYKNNRAVLDFEEQLLKL